MANTAPLAALLPFTDANGGVYRTEHDLRQLLDRTDIARREPAAAAAPAPAAAPARVPGGVAVAVADVEMTANPAWANEDREDADDAAPAEISAERDRAARDAPPSKLEQGADWYDRGTAAISRRIERCTGKDMRAINISFILVTSFVKMVLITSQLVGETNRLASEGIGTNNPAGRDGLGVAQRVDPGGGRRSTQVVGS